MTRPTHIDPDGNPCFPEGVEGATPLPAGYWDERDFEAAKAAKRNAVKNKRDAVEWGGCMTPYGPIDTNPESQRKLGGGSTAALAIGPSFTKNWRMADNSLALLDQAKMIEVGLIVVAHVDACQQRKNALDAEIDAATTMAELDAIDIESGWPG